jgi:hypothetical protein
MSKDGKKARMAYIALAQVIVTNLFVLLIPAGGSLANSLFFEVSLHDIEIICFYSIDGNAHSINSLPWSTDTKGWFLGIMQITY